MCTSSVNKIVILYGLVFTGAISLLYTYQSHIVTQVSTKLCCIVATISLEEGKILDLTLAQLIQI